MRAYLPVRPVRFAALAAALSLVACGGGGAGTPVPTTGGVQIRMHDRPIDADNVFVTIESVEILREVDGEEVRETVTSVPGQYDLLELQDGVEAVLGEGEFPPGLYRWIRLHVARDSKKDIKDLPADQLKNYIVVDGTAHPLVIPSGHQTGIKLGKNFTVSPGGITTLTIDFDVRLSVHRCGKKRNAVYRLKPRIRVTAVDQDGAGDAGTGISGAVSTSDGTGIPSGAVVSAQQNGAEVASGAVDSTGTYSIPGLADGTYDLVVIAPGYDYASETGVVVTGGAAAAPHDFSIASASVGAVFGVVSPAGEDVTVRLLWNGFTVATVGADPTTGDYVIDNVPAGSYTVEATDGTSTASGAATVTGGAATQVDLGL